MRSAKTKQAVFGAIALIALALFTATETKAMSKVCLFSPVKGKVTRDGRPVAGATIVRTYNWTSNDKKGGDETKTDASGEFSFPAIYQTMLLGSLLPHEPVVRQKLTMQLDGKLYELFECSRHNYKEGCEFGYDIVINPLELACDLANEPEKHAVGSTEIPRYYYGIGILNIK